MQDAQIQALGPDDQTLPPELSLLLACLHPSPNPATIATRCRRVTDWTAFVDWWVQYHRGLPLVHRCLTHHAWHEVPGPTRERLARMAASNVRRSLVNTAALVRLSCLLSGHGIRHLAFKGPTLALRMTGQLALRRAGDLDVLLDPSRIDEAHDVLASAGYRVVKPEFDLSPRQRQVYRWFSHHSVCLPPEGAPEVELHWRLTQVSSLLPVSFERLWARAQTEPVAGAPVPGLSDVDLAVYLCTHGAVHVWRRLFWLADVAALIDRTDCDWNGVHASAAARDGAVRATCRLVEDRIVTRHAGDRRTSGTGLRDTLSEAALRSDPSYKVALLGRQALFQALRLSLWCVRYLRRPTVRGNQPDGV